MSKHQIAIVVVSILVVVIVGVSGWLVSVSSVGQAWYPGCSDTDNGLNSKEQGIVVNGLREYQDKCLDAGTLLENYCQGDFRRWELRNCACNEGRC
jgi:hypothetical protein